MSKTPVILISVLGFLNIPAMLCSKNFPKTINEVKIVDAASILSKYGIKEFKTGSAEISNLDFDIQDQVGVIEKDSIIDTPEEGATAFVICDPKLTKDLALQTTTMWLKKGVDEGKNYSKAIEIIKDKSKVSQSEINGYFDKAMTAEVMKSGKKYLGKYFSNAELANSVLEPIISYYTKPNKVVNGLSNYQRIVQVVNKYYKDHSQEKNGDIYIGLYDVLLNLNRDLRYKVSDDVTSGKVDVR